MYNQPGQRKSPVQAGLLLLKFVVAAITFASASVLAEPPNIPSLQKSDPHVVYVVDAAGIEDANEIFTLTALQGIVNRDAPRLFVRAYFHKFGPEDQVFMDYLAREKGYRFKWVSLGEAIEIFKSQGLIKGITRYDGSRYEQGCIAATLAGLEDLLPVSDAVATRRSTLLSGKDWRVEDRFDRGNPVWRPLFAELHIEPSGTTLRRRSGSTVNPLHAPFAGLQAWLSIDINQTPFLEVETKNLGDVWSLIFDQGAVHTGQNSWVWIEKNTKRDGVLCYDLREIPQLVRGRRRTLVRFIVPTEASSLQVKSFRLLDANKKLVKEEPAQRDWFAGLQTKIDLSRRFPDPEAAWQWAVSELLPKTSTEYAFAAQPGWFNTRGIDFAVSSKAFVFQKMDAKGKPEQNPYAMAPLLDSVMQHLKRPGTMLGWIGEEWKSVTILTANGHGLFHSGAANLSFWSKVPTEGTVRLPRNETPGKRVENKFYVCFGVNPGDTPNGFMSLWWNDGNWLDPDRGKVPMTWALSPTAYKCIPAAVEFFAKTATPKDTFIIPPTGALYIYPSAAMGDEKVLFPLIDETRRLSAQMGLEGMMIWDPCMQYPHPQWYKPGANPPIRLFQKAISGRYQNVYLKDGTPLLLTGASDIYKPTVPRPAFNYNNMDQIAEQVPYMIELLRNISARHTPPFFICLEMRLPPHIKKQIIAGLDPAQFDFVGSSDLVNLARESSHFVAASRDDAITPGSTVAIDIDLYNPDGKLGAGGVVTWKLPAGFTANESEWVHPEIEKGSKASHAVTITAPLQLTQEQVKIEFFNSRLPHWSRTVTLDCFQGNTVVIDDFKDASKWKINGEGQIFTANGMAEFRPSRRNLHAFCKARFLKNPIKDPSMSTEVDVDFDRGPQLEINVYEVRGKFTLLLRDQQNKTCKLLNLSNALGKTIIDLKAASQWTGRKRVDLVLYPRINSGGSMYVNSIKLHYNRP